MWPLIMGCILLFIAVALGLAINHDPGYLLISFHHISIETSLWVGVAMVLILFVVLYAVLRTLSHARRMPDRWSSWGEGRRHKKAHTLTGEGLCYFAEGKWRSAEKTLARAAQKNADTLINFLGAARAAQAQHAYARRDRYLRIAYKKHKKARLAISLTQAQLQIASEQWDEAKHTLEQLHKQFPKSQFSLHLLAKTYQHLQDWEPLHQLLPELQKQGHMPQEELDCLNEQTCIALLAQASNENEKSLQRAWNRTPKNSRFKPAVLRAYTQYLIKLGNDDEASALLEVFLKKQWDGHLVRLYGTCRSKKNKKNLAVAEQWLKKHPNDPDLLVTLGHLSQQQKLWGKAKDYYRDAVTLAPLPSTYRDLAAVYEALNEPKHAMQCYRDALNVEPGPYPEASGNLPQEHTLHRPRPTHTPPKKKKGFWKWWS